MCRRATQSGALLQLLHLLLEHLIAVLQLLDRAGELTKRALDPVEPRDNFRAGGLVLLLRRTALIAVEQIVEKARPTILRKSGRSSERKRDGGRAAER